MTVSPSSTSLPYTYLLFIETVSIFYTRLDAVMSGEDSLVLISYFALTGNRNLYIHIIN